MQDTAVTVRQRIGSRFGVLIGVIFLPLLAIAVFVAMWGVSLRYVHRATGSRLVRTYRGAHALTAEHAEQFQQVLRSRSAAVIGTLNPSVHRGNVVVEAWAVPAERVAYVAVYAFSPKEDPHWEIVDFAGPDYDEYEQVFLGQAAR